jgi:putative spermidine/putrescine transport system permease protein
MKRLVDRVAGLVIGALVLLGLAMVVGPLVYAGAMSLDARRFLGSFPPPALSLQWYERFFASDYYMRALVSSAVVSLSAALVSTVLGAAAALGMAQLRGRAASASATLVAAPQVTPHVVLGFGLLLAFAWMGIGNAYARLILAHVVITLPYVVRLVSAALLGVRPVLLEAALSLGARPVRVVGAIVLPLIRTGLFVAFIFALAVSLDDVAVSIFLTDPEVVTLPVALISNMKSSFDLTIAAASMMMVALAAVIVFVLSRFISLGDLLVGHLNAVDRDRK